MTLSLDAQAFAGLLADPAAAEVVSAAAGCPLVVVSVPDAAAARCLAPLSRPALPAVVVLVVPDPGCLPASATQVADVILTEDDTAAAPFVAPPRGLASAVRQVEARLAQHPVAGTTLALLLRTSARQPIPEAVVAESAAYSALQAGEEFRAWRAARPRRPAAAGDGVSDRLRTEQSGDTLRITLTRPLRRNAVDYRMRDALAAVLAGPATTAARIELRGDGPDFCAGGDLDEFGTRPDPAQAHLIRLTRSPALLLHGVADRTVAYLHGACLGAGIELPAFAGRVVAAPDTRIGLPEITLGLIPGAGGSASLPRRIGRWRTAFLALTGDPVTADVARRWGLVDAIEQAAQGPA